MRRWRTVTTEPQRVEQQGFGGGAGFGGHVGVGFARRDGLDLPAEAFEPRIERLVRQREVQRETRQSSPRCQLRCLLARSATPMTVSRIGSRSRAPNSTLVGSTGVGQSANSEETCGAGRLAAPQGSEGNALRSPCRCSMEKEQRRISAATPSPFRGEWRRNCWRLLPIHCWAAAARRGAARPARAGRDRHRSYRGSARAVAGSGRARWAERSESRAYPFEGCSTKRRIRDAADTWISLTVGGLWFVVPRPSPGQASARHEEGSP